MCNDLVAVLSKPDLTPDAKAIREFDADPKGKGIGWPGKAATI